MAGDTFLGGRRGSQHGVTGPQGPHGGAAAAVALQIMTTTKLRIRRRILPIGRTGSFQSRLAP
jgi:hypothetical protein